MYISCYIGAPENLYRYSVYVCMYVCVSYLLKDF